jgi:hypothetical protein
VSDLHPSARQDAAAPPADAFGVHLAEHAAEYFSDVTPGGARVSLRREDARPYSTMYEYEIDSGRDRHSVLVKLPAARERSERPPTSAEGRIRDRPRRASALDPALKSEAEYAALAMIHDEFQRLADPRFGTVPPLDFVRAHRALVMEKVADPRLPSILLRGSRFRGSRADEAVPALRNTGAWLRAYHELGGCEHTGVRHATRNEFLDYIAELTDYLVYHERHGALFRRVQARVEAIAAEALPADLPLGMTHGDFAPRNVLVGDGARVTVIDTLARWRAPIYDDLGDFVFALKASKPQVYSQGVAFGAGPLARWQDAFLDGYFGPATRPAAALWLFEIQALLERWASARRVALGASGASLAIRARTVTATRFLTRYLDRLVDDLDGRK